MKRRLLALIIVAAAVLPALLTLHPGPARGQGPGPGGPGPGGPQRSPWPEKAKNLKVLPKDTDANTLRTTMVGYANALGVRCVHCHVGKADTPLLDIDFAKRETFAYACEVYSRIVELGDSATARRRLLVEVEDGPMPTDEKVDTEEFIAVLRGAVAARNGWKCILEACAPIRRTRAA